MMEQGLVPHPAAALETACAACCRGPSSPGRTACTGPACLHLLPGRSVLCLCRPANLQMQAASRIQVAVSEGQQGKAGNIAV